MKKLNNYCFLQLSNERCMPLKLLSGKGKIANPLNEVFGFYWNFWLSLKAQILWNKSQWNETLWFTQSISFFCAEKKWFNESNRICFLLCLQTHPGARPRATTWTWRAETTSRATTTVTATCTPPATKRWPTAARWPGNPTGTAPPTPTTARTISFTPPAPATIPTPSTPTTAGRSRTIIKTTTPAMPITSKSTIQIRSSDCRPSTRPPSRCPSRPRITTGVKGLRVAPAIRRPTTTRRACRKWPSRCTRGIPPWTGPSCSSTPLSIPDSPRTSNGHSARPRSHRKPDARKKESFNFCLENFSFWVLLTYHRPQGRQWIYGFFTGGGRLCGFFTEGGGRVLATAILTRWKSFTFKKAKCFFVAKEFSFFRVRLFLHAPF